MLRDEFETLFDELYLSPRRDDGNQFGKDRESETYLVSIRRRSRPKTEVGPDSKKKKRKKEERN